MIEIESDENIGFVERIAIEFKLFSIMLSDEGWYLDYDLAIQTLSELYIIQVVNGKKVLDEYLIDFYKNKLEEIIIFFSKYHQTRYSILKKAFYAHKMGDYELSIPVFLSQIEGLFFDLTQKEIFSSGRGKKKENTPKEWLETKGDRNLDFRLSILEPLKENQNISASFNKSDDFPNSLNRNKILHGRVLDYPQEINSYKTISLLHFVGTIIYDIEKNQEKISWT